MVHDPAASFDNSPPPFSLFRHVICHVVPSLVVIYISMMVTTCNPKEVDPLSFLSRKVATVAVPVFRGHCFFFFLAAQLCLRKIIKYIANKKKRTSARTLEWRFICKLAWKWNALRERVERKLQECSECVCGGKLVRPPFRIHIKLSALLFFLRFSRWWRRVIAAPEQIVLQLLTYFIELGRSLLAIGIFFFFWNVS